MNRILKFSFFLLAMIVSSIVYSQEDYTLIEEENGVKVYAKWGREKFFKKDSPRVLLVWVENTTENDVVYEIGTDFFFKTTLSETFPEQQFCVKSGKSRKGKLDGIYYKSCELSNEEMKSEDFDYTISFSVLNENADCSEFDKEEE